MSDSHFYQPRHGHGLKGARRGADAEHAGAGPGGRRPHRPGVPQGRPVRPGARACGVGPHRVGALSAGSGRTVHRRSRLVGRLNVSGDCVVDVDVGASADHAPGRSIRFNRPWRRSLRGSHGPRNGLCDAGTVNPEQASSRQTQRIGLPRSIGWCRSGDSAKRQMARLARGRRAEAGCGWLIGTGCSASRQTYRTRDVRYVPCSPLRGCAE